MSAGSVGWRFTIAGLLCWGVSALTPLAAQEAETRPWLVRVRAAALLPSVDADSPVGGQIRVTDAYVPELDLSFFWTRHWASELVVGTTNHDVRIVDSRLGDLDLGTVWALPATLMLQYHPLHRGRVRPYVAGGVTYAFFYKTEVPGPLITRVEYDDGAGVALQGGLDVYLGGRGWVVNLDVKKAFLETRAILDGGFLTADVTMNPWIVSAGFGLRFRHPG